MQKALKNPTNDDVERSLVKVVELIRGLPGDLRPNYLVIETAIRLQLADRDGHLQLDCAAKSCASSPT